MTPSPNYPLVARLQWHLTRWRWLANAIDACFHRPYRNLLQRRWENKRSPERLSQFEAKAYSQNGEDGVIREIFKRIGQGNKFVVEFGAQSGAECCARNLIMHAQWKALLIDGSEQGVKAARRLYAGIPRVSISRKFIKVENILEIFQQYGVPAEPDLLVIDIDGNDYWIWQQILTAYRPRVVVIEYNGKWGPTKEWIMPYRADHSWDGSAYFGASLNALTRLAKQSGYSLVGCESRGVNAFFVRDDEINHQFAHHDAGARYHYVPPGYGRGLGYPYRSPRLR